MDPNYQNEIEAILREYQIFVDNYTNEDSINVKGNVFLKNRDSIRITIKFQKVSGDFNCSK
jgi:hypothetical protein